MSRRSAAIVQQLVAARSAAAACGQQQQLNGLAITGATRFMSSAANPNSKEGKVLHPDLLNDNLKKTQVSQFPAWPAGGAVHSHQDRTHPRCLQTPCTHQVVPCTAGLGLDRRHAH